MMHMIFKYKLINFYVDNKLNCLIYVVLFNYNYNYNYNLYLDQYIRNPMSHTY